MTVTFCANSACGHPEAAHNKGGSCRIGGCSCPGFDDGTRPEREPRMRRVAIDLPDGYMLSISLIPHDPDAEVIDITSEVSASRTTEEVA
jgi:hypothetical protein